MAETASGGGYTRDLQGQTGLGGGNVGGEPIWLLTTPDPVYAVLHRSPDPSGTGVLFVPTFGWEGDYSYRPRREWAQKAAEVGHTALRMDLPGLEDSGGDSNTPGRYDTWLGAIHEAAAWLVERCGCRRIVAVGIGLGGLLAYAAATAGGPIDDLVLWGVPSNGRRYVRELKAYGDIVAAGIGGPVAPAADGPLVVGGYSMSEETTHSLTELRLDQLTLPSANRRRALLIERDAHGVDQSLQRHLESQGVDVMVMASNSDYAALMADAGKGMTPWSTIARSLDWLATAAAGPAHPRGP